jgi:ribonuclease Z
MKRTIHIFGPKETKKRLEHLFKATYFDSQLDIVVVEIDETTPKLVYEENDFSVYAMNVFHSIPCVAYSLVEKDKRRINVRAAAKLGIKPGPVMQEFVAGKSVMVGSTLVHSDEVTYGVKGKKISYIVDTMYDESIVELVRGSTVLVCEATYDASQKEKAQEHAHMTSVDAATLAKNAECGTLVLTHVSSRYKDAKILEKEACEVFPKTYCGADFFTLTF